VASLIRGSPWQMSACLCMHGSWMSPFTLYYALAEDIFFRVTKDDF
jgi:hypothetical protein